MTFLIGRNNELIMMSKVQKELGLNLFLSFYLFFTGWLQFHHCHDAVDYLNLGDPPSQVVVLGTHCHSSKANFPLFENHKVIIKHRVNCLLCTFTGKLLPRSPGNGAFCILNVQKLDELSSEFIFRKEASSIHRLRPPPIFFTSS